MAHSKFPRGVNPKWEGVHQPIIWQYFCRKLHENELETSGGMSTLRPLIRHWFLITRLVKVNVLWTCAGISDMDTHELRPVNYMKYVL